MLQQVPLSQSKMLDAVAMGVELGASLAQDAHSSSHKSEHMKVVTTLETGVLTEACGGTVLIDGTMHMSLEGRGLRS